MLSRTHKRWVLDADTETTALQILTRLCEKRGIDTSKKPYLVPPSVYTDMKRACERIQRAIEARETIALFGDYDCDGITATAVLKRYFQRKGMEPIVRLPHRVQDGYGLREGIVREFADTNVSLVITADTGIASVAEVAALQSHGIDTIVTDHHHIQPELPPAYALLHPALCSHPEPHPSGAGVAFALVCALEGGVWDDMQQDLAIAMCGMVADLVPLQGSNRAFVQLGLDAFEKLQDCPLQELRDRHRAGGTAYSATDIAFRIAPRINAAGRLADPTVALDALLEGGAALDKLDTLNAERQHLSRTLYEIVENEMLGKQQLPKLLSSITPTMHHGIMGLVAGRLTERFGRPSLVANSDGTLCTASLRSTHCYNVVEGLERCKELLESFGGHAQAAGCTFKQHNAELLVEALEKDIALHTDEDDLHPTLTIDGQLHPEEITLALCKQVATLAPFGQANREPLFALRNVHMHGAVACGDGSHVRGDIAGIKAIGFGLMHAMQEGESFDAVVRLGVNEWQGKVTPQITIVDVADIQKVNTEMLKS